MKNNGNKKLLSDILIALSVIAEGLKRMIHAIEQALRNGK